MAIIHYLPVILPLFVFIIPLFYNLYPLINAYSGIINAMFLCLGVIFLIYSLTAPSKTYLHFNYVDVFSLGFLLYTLINAVLKHPKHLPCNDNILLSAGIVLYLTLKQSFQNKSAVIVLLVLVLSTGLIVQIFAVLQLSKLLPVINFVYKATGVFLNPNIFCTYLTLQFPLIVFGLVKSKQPVIKILCGIYCVDALFFNILLSSRAAFLAMIVVIMLLLIKADLHLKVKKPALIVTSLILVISIFISSHIKTGSSEGRLFIWKTSLGMLHQDPVFGLGFGTYKSRYNLYQAQYFKSAGHARSDVLHADENYEPFNDYLGIGIEEGVIGFLLFTGMLFAVFFNIKKLSGFSLYVSCSILVFATISLFSYPVEEPFLFLEFIALIAIYSAHVSGKKSSVSYKIKIVAFLMAVICLNRFYYTNKWLTIRNSKPDDTGEYAKLYPHLRDTPVFLQDYAQILGADKNYYAAIKISEESRDILPTPSIYERLGLLYNNAGIPDSAENNFKEASMMVPGKFGPKYMLFNYYKSTNNLKQQRKLANDILGMNIKVPSMEVDMIRNDVKMFLKKK
jgi:O-antigen ligase